MPVWVSTARGLRLQKSSLPPLEMRPHSGLLHSTSCRHEPKRDKHRAFDEMHARHDDGVHQLATVRFGVPATDWQTHALPSFTWKQRCDARPP